MNAPLNPSPSLAAAEAHLADLIAQRDGQAHELPWLDTRPLPKDQLVPWNDDHYQRDRRRAEAAGQGDLSREAWEAYAALGKDAVHERRARDLDPEIDELKHYVAEVRSAEWHAMNDALQREAAVKRESDRILREQAERAANVAAANRHANPGLYVNEA